MIRFFAIAASILALTACAGMQNDLWYKVDERAAVAKAKKKAEAAKYGEFYEVHHEGRIYVFDDFKTYQTFLSLGESAYRRMRIGAGPNGETIVFGLTAKDKKKMSGIASEELFDGVKQPLEEAPFYGEVVYDNRFYVFDQWADLKGFKSTWDAPYRFTEIGAGPGGRTIVYVLNSGNKKRKPTAMVAKFKSMHGI